MSSGSGAGCTTRHEMVKCDNCGKKPIIGIRHKCKACFDFDLCGECVRRKGHQHPLEQIYIYPREFPGFSSETVHRGVTCDVCTKSPIVGLRFKCKVCDDFDICERCHWDRMHNLHPLETINVFPWKRFRGSSTSTVHETVRCDICDTRPIVGVRYKCKVCFDFDLCEKCHWNKNHAHHALHKIVTYPWQQPQPLQGTSRGTHRGGNTDEENKDSDEEILESSVTEQVDGPSKSKPKLPPRKGKPSEPKVKARSEESDECIICYDKTIDSVFLSCGHMCACFSCAKKYLEAQRPDARCPICRTPTWNVIRTYKS